MASCSHCLMKMMVMTVVMMTMTLRSVRGHGRLVEPPSRSSMWRYGFNTPHNYDDNAINCGGLYTQWYVNNGKCGVCGDPWGQPSPRDNEAGGRYGKGIITRTYTPGQTVDVRIEVTANHKGWFEFRLCPHNSPSTPISQQCLDRYLLPLADGSGTRYTLSEHANYVSLQLQLPRGVTCSQCVLQWKWHGANNFGTDSSGKSCLGCGQVQEEFYGCSDIAIGASGTTAPPPVTPPPSRPATDAQSTPHVTYPPFRPITMQTFSTMKTSPPSQPVTSPPTNDPALTFAPFQPLTRRTAASSPATSPTQLPAKTYPPFQPITNPPTLAQRTTRVSPLYPFTVSPVYTTFQPASAVCRGINSWQGVAELDRYCNEQCPLGNCPPMYCSCSAAATALPPQVTPSLLPWRTSENPTTAPPSPTTAPPSPTARYSGRCYGVHSWQGIPRLDKWCDDNCPLGVCPAQNCACGFPTGVRPTQPSAQSSPAFQSTSGSWTSLTSTMPPDTSSSIRQCRSVGLWAGQPQLDQWCSQTCVQFGCDPQHCSCDPPTTGPASFSPKTSASCYAVNGWSGVYQLDQWCDSACRTGLCPPMYCACGPNGPVSASPPHSGPMSASPPHSGPVSARPQPATQPPLTPSPASANVLAPGQGQCRAVNTWQGVKELDDWCRAQCARGNCPPAYCHCGP